MYISGFLSVDVLIRLSDGYEDTIGLLSFKTRFDLHGVKVKNESGEFYYMLLSLSMDRFNFWSFTFWFFLCSFTLLDFVAMQWHTNMGTHASM